MTTIFTEQAKQWFRRYRPVERPRLRLVCFAQAGGGRRVPLLARRPAG